MIHQDARVVLRARSVSVESDVLPSDSCSDTDTDKEEQKENIAPRRRARKVVAPPDLDPINPMLFSPHPKEMGMARSTPSTPKKNPSTVSARETSMTPTPRRPGTGARQIFPSPGITPVVKEKERLERKRVLEDEVNEMRGDDEDDDDLVT
jgi:hypothetical protein